MVAAVLAAGGLACGSGGGRGAQDDPVPSRTWPQGDRHSRLAVGEGRHPSGVRFADSSTGFALFSGARLRGRETPPAALFSTSDGGRSWQRLPFEARESLVTLRVASPTALYLSGNGRYHVSRDGGQTFTAEEKLPTDFEPPIDRRATLRCARQDADGDCETREVAKGERTVPQQPALRDDIDGVAEDAQGRIWAVAAAQDVVATAVSTDAGRTWRALPDLQTPRRIDRLRLVAAPDGRDLWLLAVGPADEIAAYRADGTTWRAVTDDVRTGFGFTDAITVGDGVLAVRGKGLGFLGRDGSWRPVPALGETSLTRLPDGTLAAEPLGGNSGVWLGTGQGADRTWSQVTVEPA